jgi:hypothetical protein
VLGAEDPPVPPGAAAGTKQAPIPPAVGRIRAFGCDAEDEVRTRRAAWRWLVLVAALGGSVSAPALGADEQQKEQYTREAIDRVVESHDTTLLLGGGKLMIKQSAIRSARKLLGEWGREAGLGGEWWEDKPEYQAAKAELLKTATAIIDRRYASGAWLKEAWSEYTSKTLDGEEADVIATHFQTEGGQKVRMLMDWYMGEMVLFNYTFTDRFEYELKDAERELHDLQKEAEKRIPREDIEFSSRYPESFQFLACSPESRYCPSVKYWKMLIYPLMGEVIRYIDAVSADIEAQMRSQRPAVQPYINAFKARVR